MLIPVKSYHAVPEQPGVYEFISSSKEVIYIGKAINLKRRVSSYFQNRNHDPKTAIFVPKIKYIKFTCVNYEFEALLLESKLIGLNQPKYNVIWKDDKRYIYIKITQDEYPRVLLSRRDIDTGAYFFGPFPSASIARDIIKNIREIFPFCTQDIRVKKNCFYTHLDLCNPCPAEIKKLPLNLQTAKKRIYQKNIYGIIKLLNGNLKDVSELLIAQMKNHADNYDFENAALFRDKLKNLDYLMKFYSAADLYIENPLYINEVWQKEQLELIDVLKPFYPLLTSIKHIECLDISNTSGVLSVGAIVTFLNNKPDKKLYRRFHMNLQNKIDDFNLLSEMLQRRLKHREWNLPDLILVDGGKPQVITLQKVLNSLRIKLPIIGLAKQYEKIVVKNKYNKIIYISLPRNSKALHLLQRIRDEAHRFAHKYHTMLRLKNLIGDYKKN